MAQIPQEETACLVGYKGGLAIIPGINPKTKKGWTAEELHMVAKTMCIEPAVREVKKKPILWFGVRELKKLQLELKDLETGISERVESALCDAGDLLGSISGFSALHQYLTDMGIQIEQTVP